MSKLTAGVPTGGAEEVSPSGKAHNSGKFDHSFTQEYDSSLFIPADFALLRSIDLDNQQPKNIINDFITDGFLAIDQLISSETVALAMAGLDSLISGSIKGFRSIQWEGAVRSKLEQMTFDDRRNSIRKLFNYVDYSPELRSIAFDHKILQFVSDLLGEESSLVADTALLKPPGIGREKPWHQDKAFYDIRAGAPMLGLWIALDEAIPENGCMFVIPRSHRGGPIVHFNRADFQLCETDIDRRHTTAVPLAPGGCLVFDGLLHHGTPPNRGGKRRWALQLHYAPLSAIAHGSAVRARYKRARLDTFGAEGKDASC
jgi:phytanoyl-CoA hydroxylase